MKKQIPNFKTDADAERFVSRADLTRYDLSGLKTNSIRVQPRGLKAYGVLR
jgi:CopG antitoxin of type II toxin-antitoxin system